LRRLGIVRYFEDHRWPRQILAGEINPPKSADVPILSDIEVPEILSLDPQNPRHHGTVKAKVVKGATPIIRAQFLLAPACPRDPAAKEPRCVTDFGHWAVESDRQLRDDGKNGDDKANDGLWTSNPFHPNVGNFKLKPGRYLLPIAVFDEQSVVLVDVGDIAVERAAKAAAASVLRIGEDYGAAGYRER